MAKTRVSGIGKFVVISKSEKYTQGKFGKKAGQTCLLKIFDSTTGWQTSGFT